MQCKNCERDVKSDFKYCPYCANRLIQGFEEHYGEMNPPYVMKDMSPQEADDVAFLYGRSRVVPDEKTTVFTAEQTTAPQGEISDTSSAKLPDFAENNASLPYKVYRPDMLEDTPLEDAPTYHAPLEEMAYEPMRHSAPPEDFCAILPDDLPDVLDDIAPNEDRLKWESVASAEGHSKMRHSEGTHSEGTHSEGTHSEEHHKTQRLEDAPYVSMQPDVAAGERADSAPDRCAGPSMAVKLLLIAFVVLLGILAAFVLYRFGGNFKLASMLKLLPSTIVGGWNQVW